MKKLGTLLLLLSVAMFTVGCGEKDDTTTPDDKTPVTDDGDGGTTDGGTTDGSTTDGGTTDGGDGTTE